MIAIILVLVLIDAVVLGFFILRTNRAETGRHEHRTGSFREILKQDVQFDSVQLKQYDTIRSAHFATIKPLFGQMRQAKEAFYQLVYLPQAPDSLKHALADSIGLRQKQIDLQMLTYFGHIRQICTDGQLPAFDSSMQKVVRRITGRRGKSSGMKQ